MKITVYDPKKRKNITAGNITGNEFIKKVTNNHYMVIFDAYGIQEEVIKKLQEMNVKYIRIINTENHLTYNSELEDWLSPDAIRYNAAHGYQIFLPLPFMSMRKGI